VSKITTLITVPDAGCCTRNSHELAGSADPASCYGSWLSERH